MFKLSGNLTPDFYAINTMMPAYPPSGECRIDNAAATIVDLKSATTLVPQTEATIGDLLTQASVNWAYYSGAWDFALSHPPFAAGRSKAKPEFPVSPSAVQLFCRVRSGDGGRQSQPGMRICWTPAL